MRLWPGCHRSPGYAAIVALLVYALLGTSHYSSVAPAAIDSLLVAAAVAPPAGGDPTRYVALAGLLAGLTGVLQIGAGVRRLGAPVSFISVPVISGAGRGPAGLPEFALPSLSPTDVTACRPRPPGAR